MKNETPTPRRTYDRKKIDRFGRSQAFRAHVGCTLGFREDRKHGLIYGPNPVRLEDGKIMICETREQWSRLTDCCAYCREE